MVQAITLEGAVRFTMDQDQKLLWNELGNVVPYKVLHYKQWQMFEANALAGIYDSV